VLIFKFLTNFNVSDYNETINNLLFVRPVRLNLTQLFGIFFAKSRDFYYCELAQQYLISLLCFSGGPAITLVRKLVMVLESSEKVPVLSYESAGAGAGLQVSYFVCNNNKPI